MSITRSDIIDLVTLLPGTPSRVALVVCDSGEPQDPASREGALQKKLAAYLQFIVSGQFATDYPQFLDRELLILVVCLNPPTEGMKKIDGIRDSRHPETFLPVEVTTYMEFQSRLQRLSSPES